MDAKDVMLETEDRTLKNRCRERCGVDNLNLHLSSAKYRRLTAAIGFGLQRVIPKGKRKKKKKIRSVTFISA